MAKQQVDPTRLLKKDEALMELMSVFSSVYVHVDTRKEGVTVPKQLLGQPQVVFELGLNMPNPIRGLKIDDAGWSAVLSFGNQGFRCSIPWASVYLIVGNTGIGSEWPKDKPKEARVQRVGVSTENAEPASAKAVKAKTLPPGWKVIEGGKKD